MYRYWDGTDWSVWASRQGSTESDPLTNPLPPPAQLPPPAGPTPLAPSLSQPWSTRVKLVVFVGAGFLALGSFLPWVKASAGIFTLTKNGLDGDGVLTLILAAMVAVLFGVISQRNAAAIVTLILGGIAGAIAIYDIADISKRARDLAATSSGVSASVGIGLILTLLASIAIVVGGIMGITEAGKT